MTVADLNLRMLPHEVYDYKRIADPATEILYQTDKAFLINDLDKGELWIPKSQARLDKTGNLWITFYLYNNL